MDTEKNLFDFAIPGILVIIFYPYSALICIDTIFVTINSCESCLSLKNDIGN